MHTRQLSASGSKAASSHSAHGGYPGYSAYSQSVAYGTKPGFGPSPGFGPDPGFGPNPGFAGPITYIYQPIAPTNTVAIIAMVLSLAGTMTSFVPAGLAGIVMGHIARRQIRQRGERGDAMALTALWVGYLGAGFWLIFWGLYIGVMVLAIMAGVAAEEASY
ncbi:DUF4190 domain-containing protein [Brevibacterium sp. RIT 803]|uniref:DUF4190 domain-containing protein n=1 Tax=Brevibacterium sp. RIT 803 TaxID=2810210 RepID=UPI00194ED76E|nr:DUF4190 domain-containing protein [Brevibacterium sp. RIT 803]MBM6589085.1 DUF4190 domain-containing protein [Brevibacterium sp. RIT 803]